jgi:hypothetical protein
MAPMPYAYIFNNSLNSMLFVVYFHSFTSLISILLL